MRKEININRKGAKAQRKYSLRLCVFARNI